MSKYPQPFDHTLFTDIAKYVPPESSEETQIVSTPLSSQAKIRPWMIPEIEAFHIISGTDGAVKSDFYCNKAKSAHLQEVEPDTHFCFIPGVDKVFIGWTVSNMFFVKKVKWELFSINRKEECIWSLEKTGDDAMLAVFESQLGLVGASNGMTWDKVQIKKDTSIGDATDAFPDKIPTLEHAPYQLRMTVYSDAEEEAPFVAWTYFDILVESIELHWGDEAQIPDEDIEDVLDVYKDLTIRDEKALLAGLKKTTTQISDTAPVELLLPSTNAAYVNLNEWYTWGDFSHLRYKGRWGDGPRIPIQAHLYLKNISGVKYTPDSGANWKKVGKAIGSARLLWDWHDKPEADRGTELDTFDPAAKRFVMKALKYEEDIDDEPPGCLNCHVDRGGKRGSNRMIFPDDFEETKFPFEITACENRPWAVYSEVQTDGDFAGRSGVIFQPSRMAKDTYAIYVFLSSPIYAQTLDTKDSTAKLIADHPEHPVAKTGMMEVLRRIDARYIRKGNNTSRMDLDLITDSYAVGGCKIVWTEEFWDKAEFDSLLGDALNPDAADEDDSYVRHKLYKSTARARRNYLANTWPGSGSPVRAQIGNYDQWYGCKSGETKPNPSEANFTMPGREEIEKPLIAEATLDHINKDRFINWPKRKWKKYKKDKTDHEEDLLYDFYHEKLSRKERTSLEPAIKLAYTNAGWRGWTIPRTNPGKWLRENYHYSRSKLILLTQEMHLRKVMADRFEGVTFFHYTHFIDTLKIDGSIYARQCDIGGVAAVAVNADLGLSGGFLVWDHPDNGQRQALSRTLCELDGYGTDHTKPGHGDCTFKNGNHTVVHEFGHFLHLPHARPTGGNQEAFMHDQADAKCVMNYDPDALHLCGGCALRLRGWGFFEEHGLKGFSNTEPDTKGSPPPMPKDGRVEDLLTAFYTDFI